MSAVDVTKGITSVVKQPVLLLHPAAAAHFLSCARESCRQYTCTLCTKDSPRSTTYIVRTFVLGPQQTAGRKRQSQAAHCNIFFQRTSPLLQGGEVILTSCRAEAAVAARAAHCRAALSVADYCVTFEYSFHGVVTQRLCNTNWHLKNRSV